MRPRTTTRSSSSATVEANTTARSTPPADDDPPVPTGRRSASMAAASAAAAAGADVSTAADGAELPGSKRRSTRSATGRARRTRTPSCNAVVGTDSRWTVAATTTPATGTSNTATARPISSTATKSRSPGVRPGRDLRPRGAPDHGLLDDGPHRKRREHLLSGSERYGHHCDLQGDRRRPHRPETPPGQHSVRQTPRRHIEDRHPPRRSILRRLWAAVRGDTSFEHLEASDRSGHLAAAARR